MESQHSYCNAGNNMTKFMCGNCSYPSEGPAIRREEREGGCFPLPLRPEGRKGGRKTDRPMRRGEKQ